MEWRKGENDSQEYYDTYVGKDYLCVFRNKWESFWMAMVRDRMIHNKTVNDRQRKKQGLPKDAPLHLLQRDCILTGTPEYLMKKAEYCYRHNQFEISE